MIENWNPLTQDWKPKARSQIIPKRIQNSMRLATKHKINFVALEPSNKTSCGMPVWLHHKANRDAARLYKSDGARCLKNNHRTHYMEELMREVEGHA